MDAAPSSQPSFYVSRFGQWEGPLSVRELAFQVAQRRIRARDQLMIAGHDESFRAGQLKLFPRITPSYHDWLWCIKNNPQGVDARGAALLYAALPITLVATLFGLTLFPAGRYPKIVLAAPGLLAGGVFGYVYGFIVFKLPTWLGAVLSFVIGGAGLYFLWEVVKSF